MTGDDEVLVWQKDTWGSYGQHHNIYTFVIDPETLEVKPIYELVTTRYEKKDSSKNYHRFTYVKLSELKEKLRNKVLKMVDDHKSSRNRRVTVKYYLVTENGLEELKADQGLKDSNGFYDKIELDDRILIVRKDKVEVIKK
ncbi:MAG: hypothetical protein C0179_00795 [Fervidicoccus sp.]|nr:MAG: hypothetical protein C0179_00795 [Fervidicoccus sp.]